VRIAPLLFIGFASACAVGKATDAQDLPGEMDLGMFYWDFTMRNSPPDMTTGNNGGGGDLAAAGDDLSPLAGVDFTVASDFTRPSDLVRPAPDLCRLPDLSHAPPDMTMCHPVVNELQTASATSGNDKWVEIYNPCGTSLTNWTLSYRTASNNGPSSLYTFTAGNTNPYLVIAYSGAAIEGGIQPDGTWSIGALAMAGGAVALLDSSGTVVDSVGYQTLSAPNSYTEGNPALNPPKGSSLARIPNGKDGNDNSTDFQVRSTPTPRAVNQ
jgi:hypothetical protein